MISKSHTKYIQSLQHKKFRDESGLFIAEGPRLVTELLAGGKFVCREVFALESWLKENAVLSAKHPSVIFEEVRDFELEKISGLAVANAVLAVFEKREEGHLLNLEGKITLALDKLQDPGNMGTIIRNADWFGVETILCSPDCADIYNPKVVQGTMGSLGRVRVIYTPLKDILQDYSRIPKYAAALEGKPVGHLTNIKEAILIIGNESKGICTELMELADEKITIPGRGSAESLNAAVACGIILSHFT